MQILDYYPPAVKQIKGIQQIAKAEDKEFLKLTSASESVLNNMFVSTADENGIERFEKLLGIETDRSRTLEERKMYVMSVMNKCKLTLLELVFMLSAYADDISIACDYEKYELSVNSGENVTGIGTIYKILDEFLPLQVYIIFGMEFETVSDFFCTVTDLIMETQASWWESAWYLDGSVKLDGSRRLNAARWRQTAALELSAVQDTKETFIAKALEYMLDIILEIKDSNKYVEFETSINWWNAAWYLDGAVKLDGSRKLDSIAWKHDTGLEMETKAGTEEIFTDIVLVTERDFWPLDGIVKLDGSRKLDAKKVTEVL